MDSPNRCFANRVLKFYPVIDFQQIGTSCKFLPESLAVSQNTKIPQIIISSKTHLFRLFCNSVLESVSFQEIVRFAKHPLFPIPSSFAVHHPYDVAVGFVHG